MYFDELWKDYKKAEKLNWEKLKLYQGLPQQLQEKAKNITGLVYYDLACYQALQGKKKAALKNFEKAFNSGWETVEGGDASAEM